MNALVSEMMAAARESCSGLRDGISHVAWGPIFAGRDSILFCLNGKRYQGVLRGRNVDLILGHGADNDAGVALRVLVEGDAWEL